MNTPPPPSDGPGDGPRGPGAPLTAAQLRQQAHQRDLLAEQVQALLDAVRAAAATLPDRLAAAPWGTDAITRAVDDLADLVAGGLANVDTLARVDEQLQRLQAAITAAEQLGARVAELGAAGLVQPLLDSVRAGLSDQAAEIGAAGAVDASHPGDQARKGTTTMGQPTELPLILDPSPDQILAAARAWAGDPGLQATDLTGEDREAMATLLKAPNRYVGLCRLQGIEPDDQEPGPREGPGRWEFAGEQYRQAGAARDAAAAKTSHHDDQDAAAIRSADLGSQRAPAAPAQLLVDDRAWLYQGYHGTLATRRLRVWRTSPGRVTAVVTEAPTDDGTSITNAIESVIAQLRAEYPDDDVEVIEHYLPRKPDRQDSDYWRWTLTATGGPDDGQQIEFSPAAEHVDEGSLDRVTLDDRGNPVWQPITPAELARRIGWAPE